MPDHKREALTLINKMKRGDKNGKSENSKPPRRRRTAAEARRLVELLRGSADIRFSTDEIMAMMRGEDWPAGTK